MSKGPVYSWDASVFIAWLVGEADAPLSDIDAVAQEIDQEKATLLVSVSAYSEVLEAKHTSEGFSKFQRFLKRSSV